MLHCQYNNNDAIYYDAQCQIYDSNINDSESKIFSIAFLQ